MLWWALLFFILSIIAAVLGFGGIAAGAVTISRVFFAIFFVIFLISLIFGLTRRRI